MQRYKQSQYSTGIINDDTPVGALTVGQLIEIIRINEKETTPPPTEKGNNKKYVHGLAGIRQLFNVSHATAQRYKDTIIKGAVMQQGRKIIVDEEKAIKLFKAYEQR